MKNKLSKDFYVVAYEHIYYGKTEPSIAYAVYFNLESAQQAMMKMMQNDVNCLGLESKTLFNKNIELLSYHKNVR